MGEVVLQLADGRLVLRYLLVIGAQLRAELTFALYVISTLEGSISTLRRGCPRRVDIAPRQLRFRAGDLRIEAGDLRGRGADIGGGESRVERRQELAAFDALAFLHIQAINDDLARRRRHDPVELHKKA